MSFRGLFIFSKLGISWVGSLRSFKIGNCACFDGIGNFYGGYGGYFFLGFLGDFLVFL